MSLSNDEWNRLIDKRIEEVELLPAFVPMTPPSLSDHIIASIIDHTLLKPDATSTQIDALCDEALKYKFKVCLNSLG